jgi:hypothetical protein
MGIKVEFNPDLCLRNFSEVRNGRKKEECLPEKLEPGTTHSFLKEGLRNFWLEGEVPLRETKGEGKLSRPLASVIILESTQLIINGKPYTKGKYKIVEVFRDKAVHFEGYDRVEETKFAKMD